jgi:excisionase family DNA binding protein
MKSIAGWYETPAHDTNPSFRAPQAGDGGGWERSGSGSVDGLLTVEEVAVRLGTKVRFVRRLIAERRISYVKVGRHVRIRYGDLEAFVAAGLVEAEMPQRHGRAGVTVERQRVGETRGRG